MLYLTGGVTLAFVSVVPGLPGANEAVLLALAATAAAWSAVLLLAIDWTRASLWLFHGSALAGLAVIGAATAASGGAQSPAWIYLFFVVVFAAYFFQRDAAAVYLGLCVAAQALPAVYDPGAFGGAFLAELAIAAPAFIVLGAAILTGKELMLQMRRRAERLADEQSALRRVATAVATGETPDRIYALVALELASLVDGRASGILRLEPDGEAVVVGSWSSRPGGRYEPGTRVPIRPGGDVEEALRTGRPVRVDDHADGSPVHGLGWGCSIVAPVGPGEKPWGLLAVTAEQPDGLTADAAERLEAFGGLLAAAIANMEDRARLARQASTDALTGLADHRALRDRLAGEVARAVRHGRGLSVAIIDIDHFKEINDVAGHEAGDRVLVRVADCLRRLARAEDTLGRIGGDEFAWVLPEADRLRALAAVERARVELAAGGLGPTPMTISAGICDLASTRDPSDLMQLADRALYWSKAHGRNVCWVYDPDIVHELSARDRAEHLERSQATLGLRALARGIDAKDPVTRRHSERVADLAARLGRALGWSPDAARALGEAALVHDVGKVGVPEELLLKPGPLTPDEYETVKQHAELGARMLEDVLTPEQVAWVRALHERPDGAGYPLGLTAGEIPEGAALLALSDAWDVMTRSRPYAVALTAGEALAECRSLAGIQFNQDAVAALQHLHDANELEPIAGPAPSPPRA
jgi:diguanylate cyclase (GGDEF)-like protein